MADGEVNYSHDLHWKLTQQHSEDIVQLKESQGRVEARLTGLNDKLEIGFSNLNQNIKAQAKPPLSLLAVASVGISSLVLVGGLITWMLGSMQRENDLRFTDVQQDVDAIVRNVEVDDRMQMETAYENGRRDERIKNTHDLLMHLDEQNHLDWRILHEWMRSMERMEGVAETARRSIGDYAKEHVQLPGHATHPHGLNPKPFDTDGGDN